jgi:hypothetical protein
MSVGGNDSYLISGQTSMHNLERYCRSMRRELTGIVGGWKRNQLLPFLSYAKLVLHMCSGEILYQVARR